MTPATEQDLIEIYGLWGEHPDYSVDAWAYYVGENETRASYWGWVVMQIEQDCD